MVLSFRPLDRADFPMLSRWLAEPHVERWWEHDPSPAAVERDFGEGIDGTDPIEYRIVSEDDRPIGLIQRYRVGDEPSFLRTLAVVDCPPDAISIDYLIGEVDRVGRGVGTEMIREFVAESWRRYPDAPTVIVTVSQDNDASWRALEHAGFTRIWQGDLESEDPEDRGPHHIYALRRPA